MPSPANFSDGNGFQLPLDLVAYRGSDRFHGWPPLDGQALAVCICHLGLLELPL